MFRMIDGRSGHGGISDMERQNDQWEFLMGVTASVRANFSMFVSRCVDRNHKAVHSALNKLLHNHSSSIQVHM